MNDTFSKDILNYLAKHNSDEYSDEYSDECCLDQNLNHIPNDLTNFSVRSADIW